MKDNTVGFLIIVLVCLLYFIYEGEPDIHDAVKDYFKYELYKGDMSCNANVVDQQ